MRCDASSDIKHQYSIVVTGGDVRVTLESPHDVGVDEALDLCRRALVGVGFSEGVVDDAVVAAADEIRRRDEREEGDSE